MTLLEAQVLTLRVLKQVMEEKLDHRNVQMAQVCFIDRPAVRLGADHDWLGYDGTWVRNIR
jgi:hypothetical protein